MMLFQMIIVIHPAFWSNNDFLMKLFCFVKCTVSPANPDTENEEDLQTQQVMIELQHYQAVSNSNPVFGLLDLTKLKHDYVLDDI